MAKFVLSFRVLPNHTPTAEEEAAWGQWFEQIEPSIADFGNRVGANRLVGSGPSTDVLGGYVVVNADNLVSAFKYSRS